MLGRRQLREKVMQNIYAYNSLGTEGEERLVEKNLMKGIDQIYDLYIYILNLVKVQQEIASNKIELAKNKNHGCIRHNLAACNNTGICMRIVKRSQFKGLLHGLK